MYRQIIDPINGSVAWSTLSAAVPIATLFFLLGRLRVRAWIAALAGLGVALVIAMSVYRMPPGQALLAASEGAAFGVFPLAWTFVTAIWIYTMTVESGHFALLSRTFTQFSSDRRIQAVIIAFCFGSLLEGIAGQGTPVAITSVLLLAVGFTPIRAVVVALIANTVPAAFGPLGQPITTLAKVTELPVDALGSMAGRQVPVIATVVPLLVVWLADGRRGLRETWKLALGCGVTYALTQFVTSNYISMPLADILAGLAGAGFVVAVARRRRSREPAGGTQRANAEADPGASLGGPPGSSRDHAPQMPLNRPGIGVLGSVEVEQRTGVDPVGNESMTFRQAWPAFVPYVTIVVIFVLAQWAPVNEMLNSVTRTIDWPGLHLIAPSGDVSTLPQFKLNLLSATGTQLLIAGLITSAALRIRPGRAARAYLRTVASLRWSIVTVAAMLALSFVMNASAQTATLGTWLAGAGTGFALLSPVVGWLGVALTGSDTSSNSLFGGLQVTAAQQTGLDPVLLSAANASGGVVGKMISLQNLTIGAAAVGLPGSEGQLFARMLWWSLLLLVGMCLIVGLQATWVLGWMVP